MYQFDGTLATAPPAIAAGKVDLVTLAVTPEELERLMYLDSGVVFRLVLKNPKDKDKRVETPGATEKAVMKGLGLLEEPPAPATPATPKPAEPQPPVEVTSFSLPPAPGAQEKPAVTEVQPKDDGKVEVWYGSPKQREEVLREAQPTKAAAVPAGEKPAGLPAPVKTSAPDIANPGGN